MIPEGVTVFQVVIAALGTLGIGGLLKSWLDSFLNRKQTTVGITDISIETQTKLSKMIDDSIDRLQDKITTQEKRIITLEEIIAMMRIELDESLLARKLRDSYQDNEYLRSRVETQEHFIDKLQAENIELMGGRGDDIGNSLP